MVSLVCTFRKIGKKLFDDLWIVEQRQQSLGGYDGSKVNGLLSPLAGTT